MLLRQESRTSQGVFIGIQILWVMLDIDNIVQKVIDISHYTVENARLPNSTLSTQNLVDGISGKALHFGKHVCDSTIAYWCK